LPVPLPLLTGFWPGNVAACFSQGQVCSLHHPLPLVKSFALHLRYSSASLVATPSNPAPAWRSDLTHRPASPALAFPRPFSDFPDVTEAGCVPVLCSRGVLPAVFAAGPSPRNRFWLRFFDVRSFTHFLMCCRGARPASPVLRALVRSTSPLPSPQARKVILHHPQLIRQIRSRKNSQKFYGRRKPHRTDAAPLR